MNRTITGVTLAATLAMTTTGCRAIGDIFKAGMGVGVFIAILVVGLIAALAVGVRALGSRA